MELTKLVSRVDERMVKLQDWTQRIQDELGDDQEIRQWHRDATQELATIAQEFFEADSLKPRESRLDESLVAEFQLLRAMFRSLESAQQTLFVWSQLKVQLLENAQG